MSPVEVLAQTTAAGPVRVTCPAPREVWWRLAEEDGTTLVTQTPSWLDSLCATGPYEDASRLYVFGGGRRIVVPLVRRRGLPGRLTVEDSWPAGWGIGGPLASPGAPDEEEARLVFRDLARRPALRVGVRFGPDADPVWAAAHRALPLDPWPLSRMRSSQFAGNSAILDSPGSQYRAQAQPSDGGSTT